MKEFLVTLAHEPGHLAKLGQALGMHGINLRAIASVSSADPAEVAFIPDNDAQARQALRDLGLPCRETDVLAVALNDHAGELGQMAERLGSAGVNIVSVYVMNRTHFGVELALTVSDLPRARQILGEMVVG